MCFSKTINTCSVVAGMYPPRCTPSGCVPTGCTSYPTISNDAGMLNFRHTSSTCAMVPFNIAKSYISLHTLAGADMGSFKPPDDRCWWQLENNTAIQPLKVVCGPLASLPVIYCSSEYIPGEISGPPPTYTAPD